MTARTASGLMVSILVFCCCLLPASAETLPVVRIGIAIDGPWERNDEVRKVFEREILELTAGEFDIRFPDALRITADWTSEGVNRAVERLLEEPRADLLWHWACCPPRTSAPGDRSPNRSLLRSA